MDGMKKIEFHGCVFHGCHVCYSGDTYNPLKNEIMSTTQRCINCDYLIVGRLDLQLEFANSNCN